MMKTPPIAPYLALPLTAVLQFLYWVTEKRFGDLPVVEAVIAALPIGWMWTTVAAFTLGALAQDMRSPDAWFKRLFERINRLVEPVERAHFTSGGHENGASRLYFDLRAARAIAVGTCVVRFSATTPHHTVLKNRIDVSVTDCERGDQIRVPIFCQSADGGADHLPRRIFYWGEFGPHEWGRGPQEAASQSKERVEIRFDIRAGWRRQRIVWRALAFSNMGHDILILDAHERTLVG